MSRSSVGSLFAVALGIFGALVCSGLFDAPTAGGSHAASARAADDSQPPSLPQSPETDPFDAEVDRVLARRVTMEFNEPLERLAPYLRDAFDLPVHFDRTAVEEADIDVKRSIALRVTDRPLDAALDDALAQLDMTIDVSAGRLVITTVEAAGKHLTPRVYRVDHLRPPLDEKSRATGIHPAIESLRDVVTRCVAPQSWDAVGGPAVYREFGDLVVISQSGRVHRQVDAMLTALAEAFARHERTPGDVHPIDLTPGATKHLAALDSVATARFKNVPLAEAIESLHKTLGVTLRLDEARLAEFDISPAMRVTVDRTAAPLRAVLADMLFPIGLTFVVDRGELVITPAEAVERYLTVRLYPVTDLVAPYRDPQPSPRETYLLRYRFDEIGAADGSSMPQPTDYDAVIDMLTTMIAPDSWDTTGGPGTVFEYDPAKCLVVANTLEVHRRIERLLTDLRNKLREQKQATAEAAPALVEADPWRLEVFHVVAPPVVVSVPAASPQSGEAKKSDDATVKPALPNTASATGVEKDLAELIPRVIEPKSWSDEQAYIRGLPGAIVVRQKHSVLRQIAALMDRLELFGPPPDPRRQVPFVSGAGVVVGEGAAF